MLLVSGGAAITGTMRDLAGTHLVFWFPADLLDYAGQVTFGVFFYLFPDGRFVPRWTRWLAVADQPHLRLRVPYGGVGSRLCGRRGLLAVRPPRPHRWRIAACHRRLDAGDNGALFNPLRRRVQAFVDHRFYRRKYDVTKTLETLSLGLRDETDLGALNEELLSVIRETLQPEHVSLWLRSAGRIGGEER